MNLYGLFFIISLEVIKITNAAPTLNHALDPETILRLVNAAADDISTIAVAKAAAVGFASGVAVNSVTNNIPDVSEIYETVANRGNAALLGASRAGENTWNYVKDVSGDAAKVVEENVNAVRNLDPMEVLNETESAIIAKNEAVLKGLFDAKRKAFLALQDFTVITGNFTSQQLDATSENLQNLLNFTNSGFQNVLTSTVSQWEAMNAGMQALFNTTLENINVALNNAQSGLQVSKEAISDISSQITIDNAHHLAHVTIENTQNAALQVQNTISSGIGSTITAAGGATSHFINSIVSAKSGIQEAAENFDSKTAITNTKKEIGNAIVNTIEGAGNLLEQAGVYSAIDTIVHSFAGVPTKINTILEEAQDTISNSSVVFEFIGKTKSLIRRKTYLVQICWM